MQELPRGFVNAPDTYSFVYSNNTLSLSYTLSYSPEVDGAEAHNTQGIVHVKTAITILLSLMRHLTITEILEVAEGHVGDYQLNIERAIALSQYGESL